MKHSFRVKITLVMMLCLSLMIVLCWLVYNYLLPDYYEKTKINTLGTSFDEIKVLFLDEDMYEQNEISEETIEKLSKICSQRSIEVYVLTRYTICTSNSSKNAIDRMNSSRFVYVFGENPRYDISNIKLLYSNGAYDIYSQKDKRVDANYIDLYGILENDVEIFIRSNYESINESTQIASRFLAYIGIIVLIIGAVIIFFVSKRFTKPVLELAQISKRMQALDFDAKYTGQTKDEIGILGNSMNEMSHQLERTISELKSANNELQSDIQNKIQIDEMRKEFLSNVTHELKTPIALIQGYAEGLQDNINEDAESREFYCEVIIDEAQKMNHMVKKLLTLNQLEFGQNQIEMARFDIVMLIQSVLQSVDILVKQKGVRLIFDESDPVYVWADEYMAEEVITNYISNALNHVSGAMVIEVKIIRIGDLIRIAVYNTGELIPSEEIDKVWIKFYKVDKARTREYGGSGIGLSIVKAIMNAHNRECGAVNHENGVEFWCEFDANTER